MDNGSLAHGSSAYGGARKPPPAWALGLATLVNGALSGVLTVTVPQLLAARGVPEPQIAAISGLSFLPGTFNFLVAPILDVGLSRRTYATVLALGLAALTALSLNLLCLQGLHLCISSFFLFRSLVNRRKLRKIGLRQFVSCELDLVLS